MSRRTIGNVFPNRYDQQAPAATSNPVLKITPSDNIIARLCIAIVSSSQVNAQPTMRILTPADERVPVLLRQVRTFTGIEQRVNLLLHATVSHYGLTSTDISGYAVILPSTQKQGSRLLGLTSDQNVWQTYVNVIANNYHAPCDLPENCQSCSQPAMIVVCFSETSWNQTPGPSIKMRDAYVSEHGMTLRQASLIEEQRYIRLIDRLLNAFSNLTIAQLNTASTGNQLQIPQLNLTNPSTADPIKGPNGRSLVSDTKTDKKKKDYSKGTLRPTTAEQGVKAGTDTCLTCIEYNRKCKGTTMTLVSTSRNDRTSMWKCDQCRNPQRRCLWRKDMLNVTTYDEAFIADGGKKLDKNTVQGRKQRAERRAANIKNGNDPDDDEGDSDDEDNEEAE